MFENKKLTDTDWQTLEAALSAFPRLVAAWVFGSAQDGFVRPGGDVDVGVLWRGWPSLDDLAALRMAVQDALQMDAVDLVVLNNASPVLRFEAISGRPIFCRDAGQRAVFASLTAREYEDEMALARRALAGRW
ncbi:MAG TPA: nucleotidyltransferase domain-containing protein [Anaerolineae bacterium]|nr:nucleotidyltransferase domain-containing protein [Anaerolineae bacterium]HIP71085.1 nucleotidyltransferase domain-containing protein [Anaerolineae bacterium]